MQTKPLRRHRGVTLVYTAILLIVLIGFVGLAIDFGYVHWNAGQLQNAADAAAMAGAQQLYHSHSDARDAAVRLAVSNTAGSKNIAIDPNATNAAGGDLVIGIYDLAQKTFTASEAFTTVNAVKVVARRDTGSKTGPVPLFFGPIFGKKNADVARYAIAYVVGNPRGASAIALDPNDKNAFYIHGSPKIDLGDGWVQVNSNNPEAALVQGSTGLQFIGDNINVNGGLIAHGQAYAPYTEGAPTVTDPLAGLPAPTIDPKNTFNKIGGSGTYQPGYYPNGLDLGNGQVANLNPGVYILDKGFRINGTATLNAQGVMFYIKSGSVFTNGNCNLYISPPTSGTYKDVSFFQARDNNSPAQFNGDGTLSSAPGDTTMGAGTFYFPNASLAVGGNGDNIINKLVAKDIEIYGNGKKKITEGYDTWGSKYVYLVE